MFEVYNFFLKDLIFLSSIAIYEYGGNIHIRELATLVMKNIGSAIYGEQQLVTNYSSIIVILAFEEASMQKLIKVHKKKIKGSKFITTFEVILKKKWLSFVIT